MAVSGAAEAARSLVVPAGEGESLGSTLLLFLLHLLAYSGSSAVLWRTELTAGLVVIAIARIPDLRYWGTSQAFGHPHEPEARWLAPRFGIPSHNYCTVLYCMLFLCCLHHTVYVLSTVRTALIVLLPCNVLLQGVLPYCFVL